MFCNQCGKEIDEGARFCNHCGASLEKIVVEQAPKKKRKVWPVIGSILIVIVLLTGGVSAWVYNRPINKISRAFTAGNVDAAVALYNDVESEGEVKQVVNMACEYAALIKESYLNEEDDVDYRITCNTLDKLDVGITQGNKELAEMRELVDCVEASCTNYRDAQEQETEGDFIKALELYSAVSEEDEQYYAKARQAMETVSDIIRTNALDKIKDYAKNKAYDDALQEIDSTLEILIDDEVLLAEKDALETEIINDFVNSAEAAVNEKRYTDAFDIINAALQKYPDNDAIMAVRSDIPDEAYLIGTWEWTCNLGDYVDYFYEEYGYEGEDMDLEMTLIMTFSEDGTVTMTFDRDDVIDACFDLFYEYTYLSNACGTEIFGRFNCKSGRAVAYRRYDGKRSAQLCANAS